MKLTPTQKRGIEERFAVLASHIQTSIIIASAGQEAIYRPVLNRTQKDIEACRDEVLTLVERQDPQSPVGWAMLREQLAELAHEQWSDWMQYLFLQCTANTDGTVTIPEWAVDRWARQSHMPYAQLDAQEQRVGHQDDADQRHRRLAHRGPGCVVLEGRALSSPGARPLPVDLVALRRHLPELCAVPHWVMWDLIPKPGQPKPAKVPFQTWAGKRLMAKVNDPGTWGEFGYAAAVYETSIEGKPPRPPYAGVGFVLTEDLGLVFVDLDACWDPATSQVDEDVLTTIRALDSYTELSPSGTGLHILVWGQVPRSFKRQGVEIYTKDRYLTMTGHVFSLPGQPLSTKSGRQG